MAGGGLSVCALDTELLGHHWYEGLDWLGAVLDEAAAAGLELVAVDDAVRDASVGLAPDDLPPTSWGEPRTLWTWDGPQVAELAFATRAAELRVRGDLEEDHGGWTLRPHAMVGATEG